MKYDEKMSKDWQPGKDEFAGEMVGKANEYVERKERLQKQEASKIRKQAYKGRYD